ncbi:MAG: ribonuclease P protein component [Pseudomonadota bacterium]|nr:ribonuclease P protein component [Pseudomonadota bacterium]
MQKGAKGWPYRSKLVRFGYGNSLRLTEKRHFDRVFRQASVRRAHPPLRLIAIPNAKTTPRLGIVVGKRALRRAVDRNRLKRAIRESFRNEQHRLPSMDIIIQAMPGKDGMNDSTEWANALSLLWKDLNGEG